ncbi:MULTISPECIES: hypothetical protein [Kitasatospora]|uniref:DUF1653 domain-containing protein n=2 Tax=Kitasatospora TaxID=2063 RepID=A0ABT1J3P2_9ACTN|nr:hypothetical protein [Kitasatospora paracochleata]MCP2312042.1 hypothetical protein [Kitasatospora paracochleata]
MDEFFKAGKVYRHYVAGRPSDRGVFVVVYVGRAPREFERHDEEGGVAFGWRRGRGPDGEVHPMGAYSTPDFGGWIELDDSELLDALGQPQPAPGEQ